jgi:hypothetical protein
MGNCLDPEFYERHLSACVYLKKQRIRTGIGCHPRVCDFSFANLQLLRIHEDTSNESLNELDFVNHHARARRSGTVLATYLLSNPSAASPSIYFPIFVFSVPPSLVQGQLYHIVFTNVDPNSTANYLSVNALYYENPSTPAQPTISDLDGALLSAIGQR